MSKRRRSLLGRRSPTRPGGAEPEVSPEEPTEKVPEESPPSAEASEAGDAPDQDVPPADGLVDAPEDAPPEVSSSDASDEDGPDEAPPVPEGWTGEPEVPPDELPDEGRVPAPTPTPPPSIEMKPPSDRPHYVRPATMLKGHSRPPQVEPLLDERQIRLFAILLMLAMTSIACGIGGLFGLSASGLFG